MRTNLPSTARRSLLWLILPPTPVVPLLNQAAIRMWQLGGPMLHVKSVVRTRRGDADVTTTELRTCWSGPGDTSRCDHLGRAFCDSGSHHPTDRQRCCCWLRSWCGHWFRLRQRSNRSSHPLHECIRFRWGLPWSRLRCRRPKFCPLWCSNRSQCDPDRHRCCPEPYTVALPEDFYKSAVPTWQPPWSERVAS